MRQSIASGTFPAGLRIAAASRPDLPAVALPGIGTATSADRSASGSGGADDGSGAAGPTSACVGRCSDRADPGMGDGAVGRLLLRLEAARLGWTTHLPMVQQDMAPDAAVDAAPGAQAFSNARIAAIGIPRAPWWSPHRAGRSSTMIALASGPLVSASCRR
jgi:hypothetical protein